MKKYSNNEYYTDYKPLDTNISHYKDSHRRFSNYVGPHNNHNSYQNNTFTEGTSITYIDGSHFRLKDFTVADIRKALHEDGKRWLELPNGGEINLGYVIHFEPFKFYKKEE